MELQFCLKYYMPDLIHFCLLQEINNATKLKKKEFCVGWGTTNGYSYRDPETLV